MFHFLTDHEILNSVNVPPRLEFLTIKIKVIKKFFMSLNLLFCIIVLLFFFFLIFYCCGFCCFVCFFCLCFSFFFICLFVCFFSYFILNDNKRDQSHESC